MLNLLLFLLALQGISNLLVNLVPLLTLLLDDLFLGLSCLVLL